MSNNNNNSKHKFDFSVDRDVGIQLTERQLELQEKRQPHQQQASRRPFETQSNRSNAVERTRSDTQQNNNTIQDKLRSVASTSVARADQRAFLKRVLASKKQSTARSSISISDHQKSYLTGILRSSKQQQLQQASSGSDASSTASSAPTSTSTVQDQKALLRKVLLSRGTFSRATATDTEQNSMEMKPLRKRKPSPEKPYRREERRDSNEEEEDKSLSSVGSRTLSSVGSRSTVATSVALSNTSSEISDGYTAFLNELKREVAGDHTEVRRMVE